MNAELLLAHYDRISDAPDAVARLRKFVLDLAVRGKLVEQNASDESASELITQIGAKATKLSKEGRIRNREAMTMLEEAEEPFGVPASWAWVRFGSIADFSAGRTPPRHDLSFWNTGDYPWASIADMTDGGLVVATRETVSEKAKSNIFGSDPAPIGTMIMSFKLTIGKMSRLGVPAFHNEAIISIHPHLPALESFLFKVLPQFARKGDTKDAIKGATLNRDSIANICIPLPPLAEQHRIVAKVDELMALCDRLEATQREQETRREQLTASALHHLSNSDDAEELRTHAQFFIGHLPRLTKRPDQIKQLRQTILSLAVRGKLVHQSSDDKPASELLKCISVERAKLVKAGVIKAHKEIETFQPRSLAFDLPSKWKAASLGQIAFSFKYGTSVKCSYEVDGEPVLRIPNIDNGKINTDDLKFGPLSKREADDLRLCLGDILMVRSNGSLELVGRPAIVEPASVGYCYAGYLVRVRTSVDHIDTRYLLLALNSPHTRLQIEVPIRSAVGLKNVNTTELSSLLIPLPPLTEQHRIVAKVDELMALCDKLEASLSTAQIETSRLLESVLHNALSDSALSQSSQPLA
jgi:type I restriction enzyme S subunit